MAGCICGFFGFQRSGKTLLASIIAQLFHQKMDMPVYTNMAVDGWTTIEALSDIPFNHEPKILLLDECYYFFDSRNWKDSTSSSIFINTIGKQNILLLMTAINPQMLEVRLRDQQNYMFLVKSDAKNIYYRCFDVQRQRKKDFTIQKCEKIFNFVNYDTLQVPDFIDINLDDFSKKFKTDNSLKNASQNIENNFRRFL